MSLCVPLFIKPYGWIALFVVNLYPHKDFIKWDNIPRLLAEEVEADGRSTKFCTMRIHALMM